MISWCLEHWFALLLEKAPEFCVKLGETILTMYVRRLWVLNKRNTIHDAFSFLYLEDQKLIEAAIAFKASISVTGLERRFFK
jgi:hypothetical protein